MDVLSVRGEVVKKGTGFFGEELGCVYYMHWFSRKSLWNSKVPLSSFLVVGFKK